MNWELIDSSDFFEINPYFQSAGLHNNYDIITQMVIDNEINVSGVTFLSSLYIR